MCGVTRCGGLASTSSSSSRGPNASSAFPVAVQCSGIRPATRDGLVTCRFTHVYPDGPAPYFTFYAQGRADALIEPWRQIKQRASEALIAGGGTITHHHAVGRDHMPWYERQRPELFGAARAAAKRILDPAGLLNPGVLLPPRPAK